MKTLYIVRHGKSSWKHRELTDKQRPLKGRGRRDALLMGSLLRKKEIKPDLIISSPANRALSTAKIMAAELKYDEKKIKIDNQLYFSGEDTILDLVKGIENDVNSVFVFGHNPDFTALANQFSTEYIYNLPTSGVVCIDFNSDTWKSIDKSNGTVKFIDFPSKHR